MADDVILPGSGTVVATDDVGSGRQVQLIKPVFGSDGIATMTAADAPLPVAGSGYTGAAYVQHRVPVVFRSVSATASGDTAVWTPTSGKRFQVVRAHLWLTADASCADAGIITVTLRDNTTSTGIAVPVYVPSVPDPAGAGWTSGPIDLGGYGYRSAAVNQVLNVHLSAALASGAVGVTVTGVEE